MRKINVYGLGYIGLPTASLLATKGYQVLGVDISSEIVDQINKGKVHIVEPDLDVLVKSAVNSKKLRATLQPEPADIHIITVPTPFKADFQPDLSYVQSATQTICQVLQDDNLVILESTCPVGTTQIIANMIAESLPQLKNICVAHSPERVIPGKVLRELIENDRVVGGIDDSSTEKASAFYGDFVKGKVLKTSCRTAELCKLVENSFRDVNIAFANELSMICDRFDIDVWELIQLANRHPRVNILQPGPGVGGHCIAVDPWFIISAVPEYTGLLHQARKINDSKPEWVVDKVTDSAARFKHPIIACLGATFKENIDDVRESPALKIITLLQQKINGTVLTVEPNIKVIPSVNLVSLEDAIAKADIIVLLVAHRQFKKIDKTVLAEKCLIDTKGFF